MNSHFPHPVRSQSRLGSIAGTPPGSVETGVEVECYRAPSRHLYSPGYRELLDAVEAAQAVYDRACLLRRSQAASDALVHLVAAKNAVLVHEGKQCPECGLWS